MVATLVAVLCMSGYIFLDMMQVNFEYVDETRIIIGVAAIVSLLKLFKDIVLLKAKVIRYFILIQKAEVALDSQTDIIKEQNKVIENQCNKEITY